MIPPDKLQEISARLSIVDLVGEYVSLKKSGSGYVGLCPFHGEKTPSFNVIPAKEIFHCFGCGAGGDIFSFLMKIEGLSFPEAAGRLASRVGVVIEDRPLTDAEKKAKGEKEQQRSIMAFAASCYRDFLTRGKEGAPGRSYLQDREVDPDTAAAYGLGFASERRDSLVQALKAKGFSLELAAQLGVVRNSDRGWYDLLYNRLIFPIRDQQGQVIAFAGRVLDNSLPKYINSPESPLYRKGSVLFGTDLALRDVRKSGSVIIVEGYFDHLALYKAGIKNALATCGTALTDGHIALIKKHADRVFLLFDGDNAGRKATVKAMELCLEQKLPVYVITLPQGEDPDSFLQKHGSEAFNQKIEAARPAFEQFIHWLLAKTPPSSADNKARLALEIIPRLARIAERIERDLYEQEVCRLLDIDDLSGFHRQVVRQIQTGTTVVKENPSAPTVRKLPTVDRTQEMLLGVMAEYPGARDEVRRIGPNLLFDGDYLKLAILLLDEAAEGSSESTVWSSIFAGIEDPVLKEMLTRLMVSESRLMDIDWKMALKQCLQRREQVRMRELKQIAVQLATTSPDSIEHSELLNRAEQLRNEKSAIK